MTFEDAVEIYFNGKDEDGLFKMTNGGVCDLLYIIRQLEKTYLPKIKMTGREFYNLKWVKEDEEMAFEDLFNILMPKFTMEEIMQVWLHPECIEVVE
ncbi:hypothetical protein [Pseudolactococcus reticulitermitis]|uniref:Uncharacterized protein n=1 Tax=Pseudolactococcus reticulitermitis TaxID=2025039 RepID=A0A224XAW7_9LACT|nr:hypothetical protein [Lactococcus reticulitermitis]GAX47294.1 hypothetical protein RsY01_893 [Lactococcus reticulitermitis]